MMDRRRFILAAASACIAARSSAQTRPFHVAWISHDSAASAAAFYTAFRDGLRSLGYEEGRNLVVDARWGDTSNERVDEAIAAIAKSPAQVIVAHGGPAIRRAQRIGNIPIVFAASGDPIEAGFVESLARPGRNMTGVSFLALELVGKRLELLREAQPAIKRVAIIANPEHAGQRSELRASEAAAKTLGMTIEYFPALNRTELETALASAAKAQSEAIVAFPDSVLIGFSDRFAQFSLRNRVPAISGWAQFAERGNLIAYGPNLRDSFRRLAVYVDKIARGAKPADIPVELPTTVELVINVKTAKALGVTIPRSMLLRADTLIE